MKVYPRTSAPLALWLVLLTAAGCQRGDAASALRVAAADTAHADTAAGADTVQADPGAYAIERMTDRGAVEMPLVRQRVLVREDSLWAEALRVHYNAIVLDGHVDTPMHMLDAGYAFGERHRSQPAKAHVDLPRMIDGGLDGAFFSIYVAPGYGEGAGAVDRARRLVRAVRAQADTLDGVALATTADEVRRLAKAGSKAVLLGLEGGHALAASADTLRTLRDLGVRYVTLTHINTNSWADASQSPPRWGGLNDTGRDLVRAMNRLGVLVDLSHVSDSTFYDALEVTEAPVILSHSSARALTDNVRNISDEMLRAVAANGGVVMVNFFDAMVNQALTPEVMAEVHRRLGGRTGRLTDYWSTVYAVKRERGLPGASLDDVLDHIDHVVQVAGIDHVGLGSDFDGVFDLPSGLQDVTRLPWITHGLLARGYREEDVYKILGGNALRVLEEAERVAEQLQASP